MAKCSECPCERPRHKLDCHAPEAAADRLRVRAERAEAELAALRARVRADAVDSGTVYDNLATALGDCQERSLQRYNENKELAAERDDARALAEQALREGLAACDALRAELASVYEAEHAWRVVADEIARTLHAAGVPGRAPDGRSLEWAEWVAALVAQRDALAKAARALLAALVVLPASDECSGSVHGRDGAADAVRALQAALELARDREERG